MSLKAAALMFLAFQHKSSPKKPTIYFYVLLHGILQTNAKVQIAKKRNKQKRETSQS